MIRMVRRIARRRGLRISLRGENIARVSVVKRAMVALVSSGVVDMMMIMVVNQRRILKKIVRDILLDLESLILGLRMVNLSEK